MNKIFNKDAFTFMAGLEPECVDLTVTSPPYDKLRKYKNNIHHTWGEGIWKPIVEELYRVTKEGGVVVWVVGDSVVDGGESGTSFTQALYFMECGFKLYDTMIYKKPSSSFPEKKRYSQVFEYMFVFSKGSPKTTNIIKDRRNKWAGHGSFGVSSSRNSDGVLIKKKKIETSEFGARQNIWEIANGHGHSSKDEEAYKHPAIFPEALAEGHILSWSNEGDLVLDCFMGSGTTAKMALIHNRKYIGSELSREYCDIANERVKKYKTLFN